MAKGQDTNTVHSALEYVISRAFLEGKVGSIALTLPMSDIMDQHEGPKFQNEALGNVLKISITTEWVEGGEDDFEASSFDDEEILDD